MIFRKTLKYKIVESRNKTFSFRLFILFQICLLAGLVQALKISGEVGTLLIRAVRIDECT